MKILNEPIRGAVITIAVYLLAPVLQKHGFALTEEMINALLETFAVGFVGEALRANINGPLTAANK